MRVIYQPLAVTRQYYCVSARQKYRQIADVARVDCLISGDSAEGAELLQQREVEWGRIDIGWLDRFSKRWPRLAITLFGPLRLLSVVLIDRGYKHLLVHKLFGVNQALIYRAGLAQSREGIEQAG